jgi:DNA-binding NtrC family response regulator
MLKPVILLVDDEVDLLQVTAEAVRRALPGYAVMAARSLEEAEEVVEDLEAAAQAIALAVVDHVLGGTTGLVLLDAIHARFPDARLMLFTGRATAEVEDRARERGVRVMWKPIRLKQLLGEMSQMLGPSAV